MANQTRVVLDETERPLAEQILEQTGIKTFSQLFSIFIVNYGDHLVNALKASPMAPPPPVTMPQPTVQPPRQIPSIDIPQRVVQRQPGISSF